MIILERVEFDRLEVLSQLEYINTELTKGNTLTKICEAIGVARTTIRDRFLKERYIFNKINNTYEYDKSIIKVVKKQAKGQMGFFEDAPDNNTAGNEKPLQPSKGTTIVAKKLQNQNVRPNTDVQGIADFNNIKNDLLDLVENKNDLMEMLKNYKSNINIIDVPQLDINTLPQDLQRDITTKSVKLYSPVYNSFDKLCKAYSSIKKQDLISLALFEFTNKYKK
ncbi:DNA-binding protein [Clostridium estertheticum]|uniref:DNA-binding protein n=1 Tax=Clostridium estertheticum TaxID=238834 RepID=UPI0022DD8AB5|nr:DNA-binding protein [Clostridium estertheticum]WBL49676.1 DNA-binding protein [Clostridium estertheticum]